MEIINQDQQDNTVAWISYITPIGWIVAIVLFINGDRNNTLSRFHLKQSLGIFITSIIVSALSAAILFIPVIGGLVLTVVNIGLLVLWILGLVAAIQREEKPVPLLGELFDRLLNFIS